MNKLEQPSMMAGVLLKPGAVLTIPRVFTMRRTRLSPIASSIVARIDSPVTRAASTASSTVRS